ncbi:DNA topoisomerase 2-binding protein 1-A [Wyeomyia smithii]|uniref:DNA topoisomerase 2-binding protein 1-A n=1 Tax=Wyeomyia smithii TaxID=174621 RepID=UPI002467EFA6|nr:DNA topoisomerase 2-binding protein 1-A [Wyeomyia smithii]
MSSISEQQLQEFLFVIKDDKEIEDASEDMQMAYSAIRDHGQEKLVTWLSEKECINLQPEQLSKKHVAVFERFNGPAYDHIRTTTACVVGPRCLISCFNDDQTIPCGKQPVLTTAMRNLTVSTSGLKIEEKARLSQMVFQMGGCYLEILTAACTHLIAATVKSIKYEKAAEIKMRIMHPSWVQDVWEQSQCKMINATDSTFDKHILPVFYSLTLTSTGLTTQKRNQIKQLIEENGGRYIGAFKSEHTDILILEKSSVGSAKFQAAVRCKKECLTPSWVIDSVQKGYALPIANYEVRRIKASTPTKDDAGTISSMDFNPDCTQLSMISHQTSRNLTVNESIASMASMAHTGTRPTRSSAVKLPEKEEIQPAMTDVNQRHNYHEILAKITLPQAKKSGPFLDGCNIYLSGFTADEKDKLNKILNTGGATRYDEISDRVSHVIVGEQISADFREIHDQQISPHILTIEWLQKSMELRMPAPEDDELIFRPNLKDVVVEKVPEPPSPASKKNLESMNSTFKRPGAPPKFRLDDAKPGPSRENRKEDDVLLQYMHKNTSVQLPPAETKKTPSATAPTAESITSQNSELDSQYSDFMSTKTLFVYGFSEEDAMQIVTDCENCGGTIVDENYTDVADYIVLPTSCIGEIDFTVRGRETVNCIWLETCIQDGVCYPLQYYFEPIFYAEDDPKPLEGEVLVISTYSGAERNYLIALGGILGAKVEDRLVRKSAPIVICKEAAGAKYEAAIKWELTAVNADWLRECLKRKLRANEEPYLVGKSICSSKNVFHETESNKRLSDLPEFSRNACLPTTSTDDVDIDSVFLPPPPPQAATTSVSKSPVTAGPVKENYPENYKYISVDKTKSSKEIAYEFKRLSSPELRKISHEERQVYSQEMEHYEDLVQTQRDQRQPFDPGHSVDSPLVLKHRRLSALTGVNSPSTPTASTSTSISEYEQLSVTQRVMEFDTPVRETLYKVLKEAEEAEKKITPRTRRRNELLATPSTGQHGHIKTPTLPECMTKPVTPYGFRPDASPENHLYHKRKLQVWDQYYRPREQQERRKSTPLSEIKRRFWRENLGDEYVDYIESKYSSTQFQPFQQDDEDEKPKNHQEQCQPSTSSSGSRGKEITEEALNESRKSEENNRSGEKRSREESDDDDDEITKNRPDGIPAAKRMNLAESDNVKRLSDLINSNKNAAKKTKKYYNELKEPQYSELPRFDSELASEDALGVGWRDPTEKEDDGNAMIYKGTPVFAISGVSDTQRLSVMEKVKQLGGELSTKPNEYDPACTHIICGKPNRGEKILSGIAAGKWLLCYKYLDDCCTAGQFLNEEQYEWGNPKATDLPQLEATERQVSKAAYNWRCKIVREAGKHDGVFTGFRVLLMAPKKEQFIRLLKSGGGVVIDTSPPFVLSVDAMTATHCFVDKKVQINPRDHRALAEAGIAVMSIMYLNAYLTSETLPDPDKYRLEI